MSGDYYEIDRVSIRWSNPIEYQELKEWEGDYYDVLYVICKSRKILYIGLAYCQTVNRRLASHHKLRKIVADHGEKGVWISFGERRVKDDKRLSGKRVDEIENLLIYTYKPPYNDKKHKKYRGRYLIISNGGPGNPFRKTISANEVPEEDWV